MTTDSGDQQPGTSGALEEAKFKEFLEQIKEEQTWLKDLFAHFGNKTKKMPEDVNKNRRKEILKIVNKILDFHHLNKLNQSRQGLKILTPSQMLSRLPIFLAQLKARNNSEKVRNEIIQLLYYLYKSKKLTKNIYKSLVDKMERYLKDI